LGEESSNESGKESTNDLSDETQETESLPKPTTREELPKLEAETLASQIEEAEAMLEDETLSDEDTEVLNALLNELKGGE